MNGKGKEYHFHGSLRFEGEYYHGKKWNGKGYDLNNNIIYKLKINSNLIIKWIYKIEILINKLRFNIYIANITRKTIY